jgi:hypothetical protein
MVSFIYWLVVVPAVLLAVCGCVVAPPHGYHHAWEIY